MRKTIWLALVLTVIMVLPAMPARAETAQPTIEVLAYGNVPLETVETWNKMVTAAVEFYGQQFGENPMFRDLKIRLYPTPELMAQGLVEYVDAKPDYATMIAKNFTAMTWGAHGISNIFVNLKRNPTPKTVAHELLHVWQGGWERPGRAMGPQWLREGMADYYGAKFAELFTGKPFLQPNLQNALDTVREKWPVVASLQLLALEDVNSYIQLSTKLGGSKSMYLTYAISDLAYDFLESKSSPQAVVAFLKDRGTGTLYANAFYSAFKMTPDEFETAFKQYLQQKVGQ